MTDVQHSPEVQAWLDGQPRSGGPAVVLAWAQRAENPDDLADDKARAKRAAQVRERAEDLADMARLGLAEPLHTHEDVLMRMAALSELEDHEDVNAQRRRAEAQAVRLAERVAVLETELRAEKQRSLRSLSAANQAAAAFRQQAYGQSEYRSDRAHWR